MLDLFYRLLVHGSDGAESREKEALEVLGYYHGNGNQDDPLVQFEFEEIRTAIHEEQIQARTSWFDLFRTPGNRKRMRIIIAISVFSQWRLVNFLNITAVAEISFQR